MNKDIKDKVKNNVGYGTSTAAGAVAGVVIGSILTPDTAEAQEGPISQPTHTSEPTRQPMPGPNPTQQSPLEPAESREYTQSPQTHQADTQTSSESQISGQGLEVNDVEVIGYDRMTNEDGSQTDVAVLSFNGTEMGIIDTNLDGQADLISYDLNQNGIIDEGETEIVAGQGILMQPLADAVGFNPLFAQNSLPDYVNDADVDNFMA